MKIKFCGAAKIVTGSCYHITTNNKQILVDCGMFQGRKEITKLNYEPFKFNPKKIDYVFLTHAHIDHSGLLPKLKKEGFKGKVFATTATKDLCKIMLEDSANLQVREISYENRRRRRNGLPEREPLYQVKDAKSIMSSFGKILYNKTYRITEGIKVRYRDAGHIIGSAIIELYITEKNKEKKIVFSGDLGQWDAPIIRDPTIIETADYVLIESTYGDRLHEDIGIRDDLLLKYVKETYKKGGKLLIPSFAIERTQELLYAFNKLIKDGKLPNEKIFLDSPLAIKATEIFKKHKEMYDAETLRKYKDPFNFKNLKYTLATEESMKLNKLKGPHIIIAGSGMCTGGRIRHHFKHGIWDPKNTVLFVGYQAEGTLGRHIIEGEKKIRMMGIEVAVKADIKKINSFSAHADANELIKWVLGFKKKPKKIFIVHGEEKSTIAIKSKLDKEGFETYIPELGEELTIK
ncbi:MBL fold metallo-hydrolase [archaeon]|nr:MBL fold metallo-hydrolase [archaeon]MBT6823927.1 MBL fold metallo-hydrolase [archaeon]MBT7106825.1 MBL fold metallo-hydrolase [archaeon]MBT7297504.1 MBL fold metallo-hydrolase [archaeon]